MPPFSKYFSVLLVIVTGLHADLDWGGGSTQFRDANGDALNGATGLAVLIASIDDAAPDIGTVRPQSPSDLISPGAVSGATGNRFRVLATSSAFYSGYLVNSAIPDLEDQQQIDLGAQAGEGLFLLVWDRTTFVDGVPADNSRFVLLPLFLDGDRSTQASTYGDGSPLFAEVCHPEEAVAAASASEDARYCGFYRYADFADWLAQTHGRADVESASAEDADGDGRTLFEEYALESRPSVEVGEGGPAAVVTLRASDPELNYAVEMSSDMSRWTRCALEYDGEMWRSADQRLVIRRSEYAGNGVWSLSVAFEGDDGDNAMFYRFVVP